MTERDRERERETEARGVRKVMARTAITWRTSRRLQAARKAQDYGKRTEKDGRLRDYSCKTARGRSGRQLQEKKSAEEHDERGMRLENL